MSKENSQKKTGEKRLFSSFASKTFTVVFSLVAAIALWFITNYNSTKSTRTLTKVPITVNLSEEAQADGIKIFKLEKDTGNVKVEGTGQVISALDSSSVTLNGIMDVSAAKLSQGAPTRETVLINASKSDSGNSLKTDRVSEQRNFSIISYNPEEINVYYDKEETKEFQIDISSLGIGAAEGYYIYNSGTAGDTVKITGPASYMNKIDRVVLRTDANTANLTETTSFDCEIVCLDENSSQIDLSAHYISLDEYSYQYTATVLATRTVELKAALLNKPEGFGEDKITIEPESVVVAADSATLESINSIITEPLDFSEVGESFTSVTRKIASVPAGVKVISLSPENDDITISIDLSGYKSVTLTAPTSSIEIINAPSGKKASAEKSNFEVTVMGPEGQLSELNSDSISGVVDLSYLSNNTSGTSNLFEVPAAIKINGNKDCWVLGKVTVNIKLTDIEDEELEESYSSDDDVAVPELDIESSAASKEEDVSEEHNSAKEIASKD